MSEIIFVARMKEFDKSKGNLRRNTIIMGRAYHAGNATPGQKFVPSNFVEITKEEAAELLSKDVSGNWIHHQPGSPSNPIFDVYRLDGEDQLLDLVQKEADIRAAKGRTSARAIITGRDIAKIITDRPRPALISVEQLAIENPVQKAETKIEAVTDTAPKDSKTERPDPFKDDPTPIEGAEEDVLSDDVQGNREDEEEQNIDGTEKTLKPVARNSGSETSTGETENTTKKRRGRRPKGTQR